MSKSFKIFIYSFIIIGIFFLINSSAGICFTTSEKAKLSELPFVFNQFTKRQCDFHLENGKFGSIKEIHFQNHSNNLFLYQSDKAGQLKATITQRTNSCKQNEYFLIEVTKECKHKIKTFSNPDCLETLAKVSELFRPKS